MPSFVDVGRCVQGNETLDDSSLQVAALAAIRNLIETKQGRNTDEEAHRRQIHLLFVQCKFNSSVGLKVD